MAAFSYFYYGGDAPFGAPDDPRLLLGPGTDGILTDVTEAMPGSVRYDALCGQWTTDLVDTLVRIGLFLLEGSCVWLDSPVIAERDALLLNHCFAPFVQRMTERMLARKDDFVRIVTRMNDRFSPETHLYHLVCGAVLDGAMFDVLAQRGLVAMSRMHPSGRDYLLIVYEQCDALNRLSDGLLCSYNRLTDGRRALQSFGDADGNRLDAYRFGRMLSAGHVPEECQRLGTLWSDLSAPHALLDAAEALARGRSCGATEMALLEAFGYARDGRLIVPVYRAGHQALVAELAAMTERCILDELEFALSAPLPLVCMRHGVSQQEAANELYHILFGQLNEALVDAGFAARPPRREGQGRFMQSVQLD